MTVVLDSWPVLRFLENAEPAASRVEALLAEERPIMSWMNLGEVFCVLCRGRGEDEAAATVRDLRGVVTAELPNEDRILTAGRIKAASRMAYADAFAAATAKNAPGDAVDRRSRAARSGRRVAARRPSWAG